MRLYSFEASTALQPRICLEQNWYLLLLPRQWGVVVALKTGGIFFLPLSPLSVYVFRTVPILRQSPWVGNAGSAALFFRSGNEQLGEELSLALWPELRMQVETWFSIPSLYSAAASLKPAL